MMMDGWPVVWKIETLALVYYWDFSCVYAFRGLRWTSVEYVWLAVKYIRRM